MRWYSALGLALLLGNISCNVCASRQDCDQGDSCNFESGECIAGCRSDADCGGVSTCFAETGICVIPEVPFTIDAGTSTTSDGGA